MRRAVYRLRQFAQAISPKPSSSALHSASGVLSPEMLLLFRALPPAEQAHALRVMQRLKQQGIDDVELLSAALLHDVGKADQPLSAWQRALVVLTTRFLPRLAKRLGSGEPRGLRRPFVVARQHPQWGAQMAARAGASRRITDLIRYHQNEPVGQLDRSTSEQLALLRAADDWN